MAIAFLNLNDDCLLQVFGLLDIADAMNVAETCRRFADIMKDVFRTKFTSLKYTPAIKDRVFAGRILFHVGQHLRELSIGSEESEHIFFKLTSNAHLKKLFLRNWTLNPNVFSFKSTNFQHIESLSLSGCNLRYEDVKFFDTFTNIENFNLIYCRGIDEGSLRKFFKKNDKIKSFVFYCCGSSGVLLPLESLELLPKLERVCFVRYTVSAEHLEQLSRLKSLKMLKLSGLQIGEDNTLIRALLKFDFLEELEIESSIIDEDVCSLLKNFRQLKLLSLMCSYGLTSECLPNLMLLQNIEYLKIGVLKLTSAEIASIICGLKKLKELYIFINPIMSSGGFFIKDFTEIVRVISDAFNIVDRMRIVDVILINKRYSAEKICVNGLRFFGKHPDCVRFGISFPDCD